MEKRSRKESIRRRMAQLMCRVLATNAAQGLKNRWIFIQMSCWNHIFLKWCKHAFKNTIRDFFHFSISYIYLMSMTIMHLVRSRHFDIFPLKCLYFIHLLLVNVLNMSSLWKHSQGLCLCVVSNKQLFKGRCEIIWHPDLIFKVAQ